MTPDDGGHGTLTVGSCAAEHHEPGQIRKEAALSGPFRVTQGGLTRVHAPRHWRRKVSTAGARSKALSLLTFEVSPRGFSQVHSIHEAERTHAPD